MQSIPPATSWWLLEYDKIQRTRESIQAGAGRNVFKQDVGCHLNLEEPRRFAKVEGGVGGLSRLNETTWGVVSFSFGSRA